MKILKCIHYSCALNGAVAPTTATASLFWAFRRHNPKLTKLCHSPAREFKMNGADGHAFSWEYLNRDQVRPHLPTEPMRFHKQASPKLVLSLLASLILWMVLIAGCGGGSSKAAGPAGAMQGMPVQVETAHQEPVKNLTEYIGTIRSRNSAALQPQVEGILTKIFVHSGDRVRRGQRLMLIDPEKQQAAVRTQEANRESRIAQLTLAKTDLERKRQLAAAGVISKSELDQAQAAYDAASADTNALHAAVAEQQQQLRYYSITAPVDGVVGDIPVQVGDRAATTTVLTTVDSGGDLEAYINIPAEKSSQ